MSQMTKRALEASLKKLLLEKPLTKIAINDIAEDCGISRMTFYCHFKDIYELVAWMCGGRRPGAGAKLRCDYLRDHRRGILYLLPECLLSGV